MPATHHTLLSLADAAQHRGVDADQLAAYVAEAVATAPLLTRAQADALTVAWSPSVPRSTTERVERVAA